MERTNVNIIQECIKQLGSDVNVGSCIDPSTNSVSTFISYPKDRFPKEALEERIQLLSKHKFKVLNHIVGYFFNDDRCYLIEEQQNVFAFISDFWAGIKDNLGMDAMAMYRDVAMQFIYALAYILNFFNEINLGAALNGMTLSSYHDQFEPCFTALGFPEIFSESKDKSINEEYFQKYIREINPTIETIPTIEQIINNEITIPGDAGKRKQIIKLCSEIVVEEKEDENDNDEEIESKYKLSNLTIVQQCIKKLPNDVKLGIGTNPSNNQSCTFLSFPKKRMSEALINERIEALEKYHTKALNAVIGYHYEKKTCYLIQEQSNVLAFIGDFWSSMADNLTTPGFEIYADIAMQYIYSLAYILNFFNEINLGAPSDALTFASYYDQYEVCFTGLGFPEIFGSNNDSSSNEQCFQNFCKKMNPKIKIPTISDLVNGKAKISGSSAKRKEIISILKGKEIQTNEEDDGFGSLFDDTMEENNDDNAEANNDSVKSEENNNDDDSNETSPYEMKSMKVNEESLKTFTDDVMLGSATDLKDYKLYTVLSCPEDRISKELIIERIEKLNTFKTKVHIAVIGYFYQNERCYLVQEQETVLPYLSEEWDDIAETIHQKENENN